MCEPLWVAGSTVSASCFLVCETGAREVLPVAHWAAVKSLVNVVWHICVHTCTCVCVHMCVGMVCALLLTNPCISCNLPTREAKEV